MTTVIVTGDSHTAALFQGQRAIEAEARWPQDVTLSVRPLGGGHLTREPFFVDRGDHAEITTAEYRRHFERLPMAEAEGGQTIYGISAPLHSVRLWRHTDWRKFSPSGSRSPGSPLSSGMVRRLILDDQKYILELLRILLRTRRGVFVVEAPHPFRHHPALRGTSPDIVLHLNGLYRQTIGQELEDMGVPIVTVPDHMLERGFMREDYAQPGDPHHGNALYGQLMMDRILQFLARQAPLWRNDLRIGRVSATA